MATINPNKSNVEEKARRVEDAASDLLHEGKKFANELYERGVKNFTDAEEKVKENVKEYSDELVEKIKKNPVQSVLIAGAAGFILSLILRK